ncbi:hypothetical protein I4U23_022317 [Adineta vaga]|nr:hypothetical protein I4U23_022317 [Adineta vaga]
MITIVLILAAATGFIHAQSTLYQCSMWGDPQLIQFPKTTLLSGQYSFCSFDGHAILYRSKHVLISVRSARQGDLVLDFNIVLFNDDHVPICTVNALDFRTGQRTHYKLTLFATLDHITHESTSGMCVQGCIARSIQSQLIERTANMTDVQIVTSALATRVCDLFISQSNNALPRTARSSPGFVDAVRQGCISDITLTGDSRLAGEGIENIFANALIQEETISVEEISQLTSNISIVATEAAHKAELETERLFSYKTMNISSIYTMANTTDPNETNTYSYSTDIIFMGYYCLAIILIGLCQPKFCNTQTRPAIHYMRTIALINFAGLYGWTLDGYLSPIHEFALSYSYTIATYKPGVSR